MKVGIIMKNQKIINQAEIEEKIRKVDGAMSQEGMPLTKELKKKLYDCLVGNTTYEAERKKVIEKYRRIYG